ncbi:MAG TPA: glycine betaine ABC transporter substrate-binding protein [Thermoanaerobaculia bacterium]|nr:glycine betaine ABC transporter substrate-binding protein [Thermoanaerobaculia bacterium]
MRRHFQPALLAAALALGGGWITDFGGAAGATERAGAAERTGAGGTAAAAAVAGAARAGTPHLGAPPRSRGGADRVVVGSKNFEESRLLGEMFAQLIEARTWLRVERRLGLAGTQICFEALKSGAIDVYPEYTGTGLVSILGEPAGTGGASVALRRVRAEFLARWDLWWIAPLGFENAYEIAVPNALAQREHLMTLSDLARAAPRLRAAFGHEFLQRDDGLPGLARTYGIHFRSVQAMQETLKYQATRAGGADVLDVYTTDARLLTYGLTVLRDDRGFFPPYEAAPLARGATLAAHPELGAVLGLLAGALDENTMRRLNLRLQEGKESEETVARDALAALGLVPVPGAAAGGAAPTAAGGAAGGAGRSGAPSPANPDIAGSGQPANRRAAGFAAVLWRDRAALAGRVWTHLELCGIALLLGALLAIPLGLYLERHRRGAEPVIGLLGLIQTVPSLALLAFMIPFLGVGAMPAVAALWLYSLFPMVRNTYTGVRDADPRAVEAATALGMTPGQVLREVRLPLAAPVLMAGVRTAAVITVGTATLAAFIGAGGLGEPIVTGLQLANTGMILSGAIPAAALALLVDIGLAAVERALRPAGLEVSGARGKGPAPAAEG